MCFLKNCKVYVHFMLNKVIKLNESYKASTEINPLVVKQPLILTFFLNKSVTTFKGIESIQIVER